MPDSDLILNVRQIAGYPNLGIEGTDDVLIQRGGLGGPYLSVSAQQFVSGALAATGDMTISGNLSATQVSGGSAAFSNAAVGALTAQTASITTLSAINGTLAGVPIATTAFASGLVAGLQASTVWSFNGRRGDVSLWIQDILAAGGAPNFSPVFGGQPRAPTPPASSCNSRLATTAFVQRANIIFFDSFIKNQPLVFKFNGRTGDIVLTHDDVVEAGALTSLDAELTGTPTAPTAAAGTSSDQIATTQFVANAIGGLNTIYAPIANPQFQGLPAAPTAAPGTSTAQLATTAFVMNAVTSATAGVASFNARTGAVVLEQIDLVDLGAAFLQSPAFTGVPTAPTAAPGTSSSQIATCAWVMNEIGTSTVGVMSFNGRGGAVVLNTTDVVNAGGAPLNAPALTGVPTAPTATTGTNSAQIATTAFVAAAVSAGSVTSFNGRSGVITLTANDVSAAGGLSNPSPALTGSPTATTASPGDATTRIATTAFVAAAIAAGTGVLSFNGRAGAVTLNATDVTGAGGALLASPVFTGSPQAPTATAGTSTAQIATTAFVATALTAAAFVPLAGGTMTGTLNVNAPTVNSAVVGLNVFGAAATSRTILGSTAGSNRWGLILANGDAESGANAGSNFGLNSYNDNGTYLTTPLLINRATGEASFANRIWTPSVVYSGQPGGNHSFAFGMQSGSYGIINYSVDGGGLANMVTSIYNNGVSYAVSQLMANINGTMYANIGSPTSNTGQVSWATSASDRRLKSNLRPSSVDAVALLNSLMVWACDMAPMPGSPTQYWDCALIADEVAPVIPRALIPPISDLGYAALAPLPLIATLVKAVQQLSARVQALEGLAA